MILVFHKRKMKFFGGPSKKLHFLFLIFLFNPVQFRVGYFIIRHLQWNLLISLLCQTYDIDLIVQHALLFQIKTFLTTLTLRINIRYSSNCQYIVSYKKGTTKVVSEYFCIKRQRRWCSSHLSIFTLLDHLKLLIQILCWN